MIERMASERMNGYSNEKWLCNEVFTPLKGHLNDWRMYVLLIRCHYFLPYKYQQPLHHPNCVGVAQAGEHKHEGVRFKRIK